MHRNRCGFGFACINIRAGRAYIDGKASNPVTTDDALGAIVLLVPAGHSRVQLVYQSTPDQKWGMLLSLFCLFTVLWMFYSGGAQATPAHA